MLEKLKRAQALVDEVAVSLTALAREAREDCDTRDLSSAASHLKTLCTLRLAIERMERTGAK